MQEYVKCKISKHLIVVPYYAPALMQSSGPLARRGHYIRRFQAWTQNVLF